MNLKSKTILLQELIDFGDVSDLNNQAKALVKQQTNSWPLAANNYFGLQNVKNKTFDFGHFKIIAQFNPERMRSSAAKTDEKTISERPCFLCLGNLPVEQKGLLFQGNYLVLTNPFPIFEQHLTISRLEHTPQQILKHFPDMLALSRELPDFTVFYNGPETGASAPDHFHFQAVTKGLLPVEQEFEKLVMHHSQTLFTKKDTQVIAVEDYLRPFISIVSSDEKEAEKQFNLAYNILGNNEEEPKLNVLCNFEKEKWRTIIFPREKQRPSHFFREGESRIVVGPASVEFGGILILPREEDFEKITRNEVEEIYGEVAISKNSFQNKCQSLKSKL